MKQKSDVLGVQINCPNFVECPFCFGCRNYSSSNLDCLDCRKEQKKNICKTDVHQTKLISNMINRNVVNIPGDVSFTNEKEDN